VFFYLNNFGLFVKQLQQLPSRVLSFEKSCIFLENSLFFSQYFTDNLTEMLTRGITSLTTCYFLILPKIWTRVSFWNEKKKIVIFFYKKSILSMKMMKIEDIKLHISFTFSVLCILHVILEIYLSWIIRNQFFLKMLNQGICWNCTKIHGVFNLSNQ